MSAHIALEETIREALTPWLESGLPLDVIKVTLRRKPSGRIWRVAVEGYHEQDQ